MSAQHTPGPWKVMSCPDNEGLHEFHDHRYVATADAEVRRGHDRDRSGEWDLYSGTLICQMRDTPTANAHLIAAAPDLLEAINATQRCLGFLKSIAQGGEDWTVQAQQEYDKACAIIDAAIARTKGGGHQ